VFVGNGYITDWYQAWKQLVVSRLELAKGSLITKFHGILNKKFEIRHSWKFGKNYGFWENSEIFRT
jgi:hypothetical protein